MRTRRISLTLAASVLVVALCWSALPVRSQDAGSTAPGAAAKAPSVEQDLEALQGRWERKLVGEDRDARHGAAKAVKEVKGNVETVTYFDDAGKPVHATTADFKLELSGRVKLYTFSNLKVTVGEDKGGDGSGKPLSYIYRVEGDRYYEGHGMLVDSPAGSTPSVFFWNRAK